jgi:pimeloyl-ACP methyl ester carboxylesterase
MRRSSAFVATICGIVFAGVALAPPSYGQPARAAEPTGFIGKWEGAIEVLGSKLGIAVTAAGAGADLKATIDIPQQMAKGLPLTNVRFESPKVHFELVAPPGLAVFDGELREGTIKGTFEQGGVKGTFDLKPAGAAKPAAPPEPPPPYKQEEVKIQSGTVTLAGTLTLPDSAPPFPAVVLITGSGPQNRDEEVFGMKPFRLIADAFTRKGIAVLRCDDRGVGGSTGSTPQSSSSDFADDALAQVRYLKGRPEIDKARIGLLGHSEGGLVAPIAASRSSDVAFIVLLSGPAVTGEQILYGQAAALMRAAGGTEEAIRKNTEVQRLVFAAVRSGTGWDHVAEVMTAEMKAVLDAAPPAQQLPPDKRDALIKTQVDAQIASSRTPWFKFFLDYDPAPTLQIVKCPVLAVFGERDLQVPVALNRDPMEQALKSGGNTAYTVEVMPRANHLYQQATTGAVQEYTLLKKEFVPELLPLLTSWILKQGPARK